MLCLHLDFFVPTSCERYLLVSWSFSFLFVPWLFGRTLICQMCFQPRVRHSTLRRACFTTCRGWFSFFFPKSLKVEIIQNRDEIFDLLDMKWWSDYLFRSLRKQHSSFWISIWLFENFHMKVKEPVALLQPKAPNPIITCFLHHCWWGCWRIKCVFVPQTSVCLFASCSRTSDGNCLEVKVWPLLAWKQTETVESRFLFSGASVKMVYFRTLSVWGCCQFQ